MEGVIEKGCTGGPVVHRWIPWNSDETYPAVIHTLESKSVATIKEEITMYYEQGKWDDYKKVTNPYEYIFLSPIFDSISKVGYKGNFDLKLLRENLCKMKQENPSMPKVIGLGGITAQNMSLIVSAGFDGLALLGAIWQSQNPPKAFSEIQTMVSQKT